MKFQQLTIDYLTAMGWRKAHHQFAKNKVIMTTPDTTAFAFIGINSLEVRRNGIQVAQYCGHAHSTEDQIIHLLHGMGVVSLGEFMDKVRGEGIPTDRVKEMITNALNPAV